MGGCLRQACRRSRVLTHMQQCSTYKDTSVEHKDDISNVWKPWCGGVGGGPEQAVGRGAASARVTLASAGMHTHV